MRQKQQLRRSPSSTLRRKAVRRTLTSETLEGRMLLSADGLSLASPSPAYAMFHALSRGSQSLGLDSVSAAETTVETDAAPVGPPADSVTSTVDVTVDAFVAENPEPQVPAAPVSVIVTAGDVLSDAAAEAVHADAAPEVAAADLDDIVSIRPEVVDTDGNVVTQLDVGQEFVVNIYADDVRQTPSGLFAVFTDVVFDGQLARTTGSEVRSPDFSIGNGLDPLGTDGEFDEIGGSRSLVSAPGEEPELLVVSVPMIATSSGTLTFDTNFAEALPFSDTLVFPSGSEGSLNVSEENIDFQSVAVEIAGENYDLVAFAQALSDQGAIFYGAGWCPHCTDQKELFRDGQQYLPFVEVTNPDRSVNQVGIDAEITTFPTWVFSDGSRVTGTQSLESLSTLAEIPIPTTNGLNLSEIGDQQVREGSPLWIPLDGFDPNGEQLTYEVSVGNSSVLMTEIPEGNRSIRISVQGFGNMDFELFEGRAPRATERIISLAEDNFYDNLTFHRVVNDFVIQGGDPAGDGSGGSDLADFDDQFSFDLQHNRTGLLSMAKSSDDTNNSQFFVTEGPSRHLDFNHTIFGLMTEGESNRDNISNTEVDDSIPTVDVRINSIEVFDDTENAILMLNAPVGSSGSTTVTVTARSPSGLSVSETFNVDVVPDEDGVAGNADDSHNGSPFLEDISSDPFRGLSGGDIVIPLAAFDVEGDDFEFEYAVVDPLDLSASIDQDTGLLTVTAPTGYSGPGEILVGVRPASENGPFDTQTVNLFFTGVGLAEASDTGAQSNDNITNADTLEILVTGYQDGDSVTLFTGGVSLGTKTVVDSVASFNYDASLREGEIVFTGEVDDGVQVTALNDLTVTVDRTPPAPITSTAPTTASVGRNNQYDAEQEAEGSGEVTYQIVTAPEGATIDEVTGLFEWTPTGADVGIEAIEIQVVDQAGNSVPQAFALDVTAETKVEFSIEFQDTVGNVITAVELGTEYHMVVYVEDVRADLDESLLGTGNTWVDVTYDPAKTSIVAGTNLQIDSEFADGFQFGGENKEPGILDEVGGYNEDPYAGRHELFRQRFIADALGELTFESAYAQLTDDDGKPVATHNVLLINQGTSGDSKADPSEIIFGTGTITIADAVTVGEDVLTRLEDTTSVLRVLQNDLIPTVGTTTITSVSDPDRGGSVQIRNEGDDPGIIYTPPKNFFGIETFTYTLTNGDDMSTGTVTVTVENRNDDPTANQDDVEVGGGLVDVLIDVLDNDESAPDPPETLIVTEVDASGSNGTVSIASDGAGVLYTPPLAFKGIDAFTYTISDGNGGTAQATVNVNVTITAPGGVDLDALSDTGRFDDDNVTNAEELSFTVLDVTEGATVTLLADGMEFASGVAVGNTLVLTGNAAALSGEVEFSARQVLDGDVSTVSPVLTVTIDRTAPDGFLSVPPAIGFVDHPLEYDADHTDEAAGDIAYDLQSAPGGASIVAATGVVDWTPSVAELGNTVSFSVLATDLAGNFESQEIDILVVDDQVEFTLRAVDGDGNELTQIGTGTPFTLEVYVQDIRDNVADETKGAFAAFVDVVYDDALLDVLGVATIDDVFTDGLTSTGEESAGRLDGIGGTNTDENSADALLLFTQQFRSVAIGTANIGTAFAEDFDLDNQPTGIFDVLLLGQNENLPETAIRFNTIDLAIVPGLSAEDDNATIDEDSGIQTIDVLFNDTEGPGTDEINIIVVGSSGNGGAISIAGDAQTLTYEPALNFFGTDTFTYTIEDDEGAQSMATVTVTVQAVNDPPSLTDDTADAIKNGDPILIDVLQNDSADPDQNETLTIVGVTQGDQGGTVENLGDEIRYTPGQDATGTETFNYTVEDGNDGTADATVTVTISDFETTDVTGRVYFDANNNGSRDEDEIPFAGVQVELDGVDMNNQRVHEFMLTDADGAYRFEDLLPGDYTITQTQSGVLSSSAGEIEIKAEPEGGDVALGDFGSGGILPQFSLLYALSSTPDEPVELGTDLNGNTQWHIVDELWDEFALTEVELSSDHQSITVRVTQQNGEQLVDTIPASDTNRVQILGEVDGSRLVRIVGNPADFDFNTVTPEVVDAVFASI